jgi:hypothetical protein
MPDLSLLSLAGIAFDAADQPRLPEPVAAWCASNLQPGWSLRTHYAERWLLNETGTSMAFADHAASAGLPEPPVCIVFTTPILSVVDEVDRVAFILRWL